MHPHGFSWFSCSSRSQQLKHRWRRRSRKRPDTCLFGRPIRPGRNVLHQVGSGFSFFFWYLLISFLDIFWYLLISFDTDTKTWWIFDIIILIRFSLQLGLYGRPFKSPRLKEHTLASAEAVAIPAKPGIFRAPIGGWMKAFYTWFTPNKFGKKPWMVYDALVRSWNKCQDHDIITQYYTGHILPANERTTVVGRA